MPDAKTLTESCRELERRRGFETGEVKLASHKGPFRARLSRRESVKKYFEGVGKQDHDPRSRLLRR